MTKRYFVDKNDEYVWPLQEFIDRINSGEVEEFILSEEKIDYGGEMWCKMQGEFVETGGGICSDCGKQCSNYSPCNGKSGRCRHLKNGFIGTGKYFKLTKDGLLEVPDDNKG